MKTNLVIYILYQICGLIFCSYNDHELLNKFNYALRTHKLSNKCHETLAVYLVRLNLTNIKDDSIWALQMFDSTAKLPSGLLSYNFGEMGNFQQCIDIQSKSDKILGKYCSGNVVVNRSAIHGGSSYLQKHTYLRNLMLKVAEGHKLIDNPTWAMCLPSNCTKADAMQLMDMSDTLGLRLSSIICQTKTDANPVLDSSAIFGITFFSTLIFIIIISTVLDTMNQSKEKSTLHPILTIFSLNKNCKTLFSIPRRYSNLSCLDGLKVISMLWIVTLHVYQGYAKAVLINSKDFVDFTDSLISMLIYNGGLACDTFLLIGGILVTYVFFKKNVEENMTITNILKHYFHRYIRLTPAVIGLIVFHISAVKYLGSGPNWPKMLDLVGYCQKYWWSTLLYVQNFVNVDEMCADHTWYLNVDMQLYLLSPFIFWLLRKSSRIGIAVLLLAALVSMTFSFTIAYLYELSAITNTHYFRGPLEIYMNQYYFKTETRATPWFFGAILGYILTKKNKISQLSKIQVVCLWVLNLAAMVICVLAGHSTLRLPQYRRFENALAMALIRPCFSLAVGWIIWACATDQGGVINKFLSHPIFQFLNKFILSIYLLHVTVIKMISLSGKSSIYFSPLYVAFDVWGICVYMFGLSIIWILVFEIPMLQIEKIIFSK